MRYTVEAVLGLDPEAATPYICKFEKGKGRHAEDGIRISVGQVDDELIAARLREKLREKMKHWHHGRSNGTASYH